MYPTIIEIGGFTITSYGVMVMIAFMTGAWLTAIQLRRRGLNPEFAWDMVTWVALGGIVGAKAYYLALHWPALLADPLHELTNRAGLVWYGGLIGGVLAFLWQARRWKLPLLPAFDAAAPAMTLSYAVGRIGCFLVGENYGSATGSWVGIAFPQGNPPSTAGYLRSVGESIPASVPDSAVLAVHPTQLYEVGMMLIVFAVLWRVARRSLRPGRLFGLHLALAGLERFVIEFVRAKDDRFVFGLTTSQVFAALAVAAGFWLWSRRTRQDSSGRANGNRGRGLRVQWTGAVPAIDRSNAVA